jgi:hypothetical protein
LPPPPTPQSMTLARVVYASPDNISANFRYPQLANAHDQALGLTGVCLETSQCASGLNDGLVGFYTNGDCPNGKSVSGHIWQAPEERIHADRGGTDPANVKCCFIVGCSVTDAIGFGWCKNTNEGCAGPFTPGRCPGPSNVQCC